MITVNGGVQVGWGRGVGKMGRWGKTPVQTFSNLLLKTLTEGAVTTEAGSLFQYFTTLTENADPLLRRWLGGVRFRGALLGRFEQEGRIGVTNAQAFWLAHLRRGDLIGQAHKHVIGVRGPSYR